MKRLSPGTPRLRVRPYVGGAHPVRDGDGAPLLGIVTPAHVTEFRRY
jgi:hypothetical protein